MSADPRPVVLDACVCINVAAAVPLRDVARLVARPVVVVTQAAAEALFLHDIVDEEHVRTAIDLSELEEVALEQGEFATYAALARGLDDGEAASLAVAHHRGWSIATDGRAARRVARNLDPPADVVTTSVLLRTCAESLELDAEALAHLLGAVEARATFVPPRDDPNRDWWQTARSWPRA
jgi:predicted nucleic acid-binding protein